MCSECEIKVRVKIRKTESRIVIDIKTKKVSVIECNLMKQRCFSCVPFCEAIVAAKDFAFGRRKPRGEVMLDPQK